MLSVSTLKAAIATLALVCITVLLALGKIEAVAGLPMITMVIGYAIGNGVAAMKDIPVHPIFQRHQPPEIKVEGPVTVKVVTPTPVVEEPKQEP